MARTFAEMRRLSKAELIADYDRLGRTVPELSLAFIRDEIFQRELEAQGARMEEMTSKMARLTNWILWLTVTIGVLTAINLVYVVRPRC